MTTAANISMERMRASRLAQAACVAQWRLARTAHAGRWSHTRGAPHEELESPQDVERRGPLGSTFR